MEIKFKKCICELVYYCLHHLTELDTSKSRLKQSQTAENHDTLKNYFQKSSSF